MSDTLRPGLYIVATPIGNLGDITARAVHILSHADVILVEDSRVSGRLLNHFNIKTPMRPYHDHNAAKQRPKILKEMQDQVVALISDAGTPLISDPGYKLVQEARDLGLYITTAPGPSAAIAALSISGLPSDRFLFLGFPPNKTAARKALLRQTLATPATLIFYESAGRVKAFLEDIHGFAPKRLIALCREITKYYEEVIRGTPDAILERLSQSPVKGEIVLLIGPSGDDEAEDIDVESLLREALQNQSLKEAVANVTAQSGLPRKTIYALALKIAKE